MPVGHLLTEGGKMLASAASQSSGLNPGVTVVLVLAAIVMYWLPTLIAWLRHVPHLGSVAVIDGFLGWTGIGWVVALSMACRSRHTEVVPMVQPVTRRGHGTDEGQRGTA